MSQRQSTRKQRRQEYRERDSGENVASSRKQKKEQAPMELMEVYPKPNTHQIEAFNIWNSGKHLVMYGFPGTGKSFLALNFALGAVADGQYKQALIIRSAVPSRDVGFMPGTKKQKSEVYEAPYANICNELFGRGDAYSILKQKGILDFEITSYLRGLTVDDTVMIIDEFQSMTEHELYTILSRAGRNTRVIVSGDIGQNDLTKEKSGFPTMMKVFDRMGSVGRIEFDINDIVRSGFCKELIIARESLRDAGIRA
jgi:phosphate starvation-inducible PhoH-like protein